jgi:predicted nuclease with RNAse H fold
MVVSVGIDVAEERKGLDLVALGSDRQIVARLAHADIADVSRAVAELRPDVVAIDSPPGWAARGRSRTAERELARLGISAYATPTDPGAHPFYRWMRVGFATFAAIADTYPRFRHGVVGGTAIEVFPAASAVLLDGRLRSQDETKVRFRRRVLAAQGIDTAELSSADAVDATLAALTGLLALEGEFSVIGEPDEGVIVVPVRVLPSAPLVRHPPSAAARPMPTDHAQRSAFSGGRTCECGCGAVVRRRFLPGHDARLKSRLLQARAAGDTNAAAQLQTLGWG